VLADDGTPHFRRPEEGQGVRLGLNRFQQSLLLVANGSPVAVVYRAAEVALVAAYSPVLLVKSMPRTRDTRVGDDASMMGRRPAG
jgi:hypothetical protein